MIALLILIGCVGVLYQSIATKFEENQYPPPGNLVDIGGYRLHLYSTGTGGPTVVLDAGLGNISADWGLVQPEIAKFTRVVSYDRAGTGWSEVSPFSRTSQQIVSELHTLLEEAKLPKPYILVGHSFGGHNVQLYAENYPDEVAGIVLVDSCHEQQWQWLASQIESIPGPAMARFLSTFGVIRFMTKFFVEDMVSSLPVSMQRVLLALSSSTKHFCAVCAESRSLQESLQQLQDADRSMIEKIPCFVLTAAIKMDGAQFGFSEEQQKIFSALNEAWDGLQKDLASKFKKSQHLIAEKSDHMIPWHQPEIIVQAVRELVKGIGHADKEKTVL